MQKSSIFIILFIGAILTLEPLELEGDNITAGYCQASDAAYYNKFFDLNGFQIRGRFAPNGKIIIQTGIKNKQEFYIATITSRIYLGSSNKAIKTTSYSRNNQYDSTFRGNLLLPVTVPDQIEPFRAEFELFSNKSPGKPFLCLKFKIGF